MCLLSHLFRKPANGSKTNVTGILVRHGIDHRVNLSRQNAHDGQSSRVEGDPRASFEQFPVQRAAASDEVTRAVRRLDNDFVNMHRDQVVMEEQNRKGSRRVDCSTKK